MYPRGTNKQTMIRSNPISKIQDTVQTTAEKWTLAEAKGRGGEADIGLEGFQQLLAETANQNNTVQH